MRIKIVYIPLITFILVMIFVAIFKMPHRIESIAGFGIFLLFSMITYQKGVKETLRNWHAIVSLGERKAYITPIISYIVMTLIFGIMSLPHEINSLLQFAFFLLSTIVTYSLGIFLLMRRLKKERKPKRRSSSGKDKTVPFLQTGGISQ